MEEDMRGSKRVARIALLVAVATGVMLGSMPAVGAQGTDPVPPPRKALPALPAAAPPVAEDLGDRDKDLVFVPVTPCRLADSRLATDPNYRRFAANATKNYNFIERADYSAYGGQATACTPVLPSYNGFEPEALAVNFTVTGPDASGFLRAFPYSTAPTPASNLNWSAGQTVANSAIVRMCNFCGPDLSVKIDGAGGADVIIDVFGYFIAAPILYLDSYVVTASQLNLTGAKVLETQPCNAGYKLTGGGFWVSLSDVFVTKSAPSANGQTWGIETYRSLDTYTAIVYGVCARLATRLRV
jgi:hypothetical protein